MSRRRSMQRFIELMRVALGNATRFASSLSKKEWEEVMAMAMKQGVAGVAFSGVERLPKEQMPPLEVIMDWSAVVDFMEKDNRHLNDVNVKVCDMFERDGQRACIVKGASVGVLYPEPLRRSAGDVDVWMAGGYEAVSKYVRKRFFNVTGGHYGRHIEIKVDGVLVEIHFMPAELYSLRHAKCLNKLYKEIEAKPWTRRVELDGSGYIIVPELRESLIIVIVHLFSHLAVEGVGMKQVVDCYWVLKEVNKVGMSNGKGENVTGESADEIRNWAMALFRKVGISKFIAALMYVLQQIGMEEELMLCAPNTKLGKRLLNEILNTGVVSVEELVTGKYGKESKLHRFYRRLSRALRLMPIAPSEMLWMLNSGFFYWILRKRRI